MRYPQNCQKTFPGTRQIGRILTKVWISAPKKLGNSWSFSKSLLTRMYPVHSILPSNLNRQKITHSKRHTFNHFITVHSLYPAPELYSAAPRFFLSRDTHICAAQKAAEFTRADVEPRLVGDQMSEFRGPDPSCNRGCNMAWPMPTLLNHVREKNDDVFVLYQSILPLLVHNEAIRLPTTGFYR